MESGGIYPVTTVRGSCYHYQELLSLPGVVTTVGGCYHCQELLSLPTVVTACPVTCPLTKLNGGLSRLHSADEDAVSWLTNYGKWHAYEKKKITAKGCSTVRGCYHCQGLLPLSVAVTIVRGCYHCWGLLPLLGAVTTVGYHCRGLLPLSGAVTTVKGCYHCQDI